MIIVDVETTGTEPSKHSLLSIGAIDFNKPENTFHAQCRMWDGAHVMDEALAVNGFTRQQITDPTKNSEGELVQEFFSWITQSDDHTVAGQNPSFDVGFLQAAAERNHIHFPLAHRTIDLHSICYAHMIHRGLVPSLHSKRSALNSDTIMTYAGIPPEPKPHIAFNGAKWEAEAFSRLLYNKSFFAEFEKYPISWDI